jgi:nucleoside-diphosphate-sugar epimerase
MALYIVTGCAGFIGAKVAERLLAEGHSVFGLDNLNHAYDVRLKEWRLARLTAHSNFEFRLCDIGDRNAVMEQMPARADGVFSLAARAGVRPSVDDPWVYYHANVTGTLNMLEACRARGIRKFVLASTSSVYGNRNPMPYREDANTDYPLSPYAASKKAAEVMGHAYAHLYGMDVAVLRFFTVYGPAGRPDMSLFRFVQWVAEERPVVIYGDGTQSRDFTYVDDIARGVLASRTLKGYNIINLGSDEPLVLIDALHLVEAQVGKPAHIDWKPWQPTDMKASWADISRAKELLGWSPRVSYEEGIERLIGWYMENREWARDIKTL